MKIYLVTRQRSVRHHHEEAIADPAGLPFTQIVMDGAHNPLIALAQEPDDDDAGMRKHHFEVRPYLNLTRHSLYCMGLHFVVLCIDVGRRDGLHSRQGLRDKAIHLNGGTKIAGKTAIDTEENKRVR